LGGACVFKAVVEPVEGLLDVAFEAGVELDTGLLGVGLVVASATLDVEDVGLLDVELVLFAAVGFGIVLDVFEDIAFVDGFVAGRSSGGSLSTRLIFGMPMRDPVR
jgi:hypothetical protein